MPDILRRRVIVEVPWRTVLRLIAAVALVWLWLELYDLVLLVVVAVLLAVTLNPVVRWGERRRLPRWAAATLVTVALLALIAGAVVLTWTSLASQAQMVSNRLIEMEQQLLQRIPVGLQDAIGKGAGVDLQSYVAPLALRFLRSLAQAAVVFVLAAIVTMYLLIEGRQTYEWLLAFVPKTRRRKVHETACECERVIFGYVAGNVATSIFATIFVLVWLTILGVPAALLLAVVAGVCDFIPVLGFILSAAPAILLALLVSPAVAITVAILYAAYHLIENYWIAPRIYGDRLQLSNLAVVLAFAVGASLAGVVGAAIALPIAAAYPAVERIWLRGRLGDEVVEEHRAIEHRRAG